MFSLRFLFWNLLVLLVSVTVLNVYPRIIPLPRLLHRAASCTPAVCNWQIDRAVYKLDHLQTTPGVLDGKCHRVKNTQHTVRGFRLRGGSSFIGLDDMNLEWWHGWTQSPQCLDSHESPSRPCSSTDRSGLRSESISFVQKPKFNCLLTVCSGQSRRQWECVLCVFREGCVRTPRPPAAARRQNSAAEL